MSAAREMFEELSKVSAAQEALDRGDLATAIAYCRAAAPAVVGTWPHVKLLSTVLFLSGQFNQADTMLAEHLKRRAGNFDALHLQSRVWPLKQPNVPAADQRALDSQMLQVAREDLVLWYSHCCCGCKPTTLPSGVPGPGALEGPTIVAWGCFARIVRTATFHTAQKSV